MVREQRPIHRLITLLIKIRDIRAMVAIRRTTMIITIIITIIMETMDITGTDTPTITTMMIIGIHAVHASR